jgi:hypothetical protein
VVDFDGPSRVRTYGPLIKSEEIEGLPKWSKDLGESLSLSHQAAKSPSPPFAAVRLSSSRFSLICSFC